MNKYIEEAQEKNKSRFEPSTFEEYQNMHPADAKKVSMAHIKKLKDEWINSKEDPASEGGKAKSSFLKNGISWE